MENVYTKSGALARRIYFGATTVWENLYYFLQKRVLADGGTFVENDVLISDAGASLILTPNAYKVGKLYSAKPYFGAGDFTVDRDSEATYVDEDGIIKTALANVPRIDWSTGVPIVLREGQSTNLVLTSDSGNYGGSPPASEISAIAPDGTNEAIRPVPESNSNRYEETVGAGVYSSGQKLTYSWYRKRFSTPVDDSFIGDLNVFNSVNINIETSIQINSNINGYDRFSVTVEIIDGISNSIFRAYFGFTIRVGNSSVAYWGHQFEEGSKATSYTPTNGTTVTRLADNISVPTPAGVTSITETIDGVEQAPITTIPATYSLPVGNINKVTML